MINLTPEFWLQTAVYLIGGSTAVIAVAFRIGRMEANFATKAQLQEKADEHMHMATKDELKEKVADRNTMIDRVYSRFDEHKRECVESYVRKEMCGQLHVSTKEEMKRVDEEYKAFRHEIRNTMQQIFDKLDEINRRITDGKQH